MSALHTIGAPVRVFFGGGVSRDGTVEHIAADGRVVVRITRGWVHTADPGDLLSIPPALQQRTPEAIIREVA